MFSMTYWSQGHCHGTIKVARPLRGLGHVTDIEGETWDINAIVGNTVCACPVAELHPYYTDTSADICISSSRTDSGTGLIHQTWHSYNLEVVPQENQP
jgi:hypothetical protein